MHWPIVAEYRIKNTHVGEDVRANNDSFHTFKCLSYHYWHLKVPKPLYTPVCAQGVFTWTKPFLSTFP